MSSVQNKPYKFDRTIVVKGNKKIGANPEVKLTEEEVKEEVVREFANGSVVDAIYISGRGGNSIQFESVGGFLPNGEQYDGIVNYNMRTDAQYNVIDEKIPMPKVAEVIENTEDVEASQRKYIAMLTPTNIALGVVGLIGVFLLLKVTKVIK